MLRRLIAQSPILGTTITLERLRKRGYVSLLEMYEKIAPSRIFRETAVYETHLVYPELVEGYLVFRQAQQKVRGDAPHFYRSVLRSVI